MGDLKTEIKGILDVKSLRERADKASITELFGLRLRSSGFVWSAGQKQVEDMQRAAREVAPICKELDAKLKKLEELGNEAEARAKKEQAAYEAAINRFNSLIPKRNEAIDRYNKAVEAYKASDENNNDAEYKAYEDAKSAYEAADKELSDADKAMKDAEARYKKAAEDIETVNKAIEELQKVIPGVLEGIAKRMGLEKLMLEEMEWDPNKEWTDTEGIRGEKGKKVKGDYTQDKMSFTKQASSLLQTWGHTFNEGVEIELKDKDDKPVKADEDMRLLNPFLREKYKTLRIEKASWENKDKERIDGEKAKIFGDEALIVRNMGAIQVFRKIFQALMEEISATATKRHS